MAKPNYRQQKKSKEQARKVRQEEKQQKRRARTEDETGPSAEPEPAAPAGNTPAKPV